MQNNSFESAEEYLKESALYRLGELPTEGFHTKTANLAELAKNDLPKAIQVLCDVDLDAFRILQKHGDDFAKLSMAIHGTAQAGKKIFLCGCGATGRLSLTLESLWRSLGGANLTAFMAGGDVALVRSVENFEDHPELGARHLETLGFQDGDLVIAITEGGETPFVIGAVELAAKYSRKPFFIFCNPSSTLIKVVERSRRVLSNERIEKIAIPIGPMALSGSTRLQASSVQMFGVGLALFAALEKKALSKDDFVKEIDIFCHFYQSRNLSFLDQFIRAEGMAIQSGKTILYETNNFGITILTDTTERSPTFSLRPFKNKYDPATIKPSLAFLCVSNANNSEAAWEKILGRLPIGLDWPEYNDRLSQKIALGFDFSKKDLSTEKNLQVFSIQQKEGEITFLLGKLKHNVSIELAGSKASLLFQHLLLKLILNIHSLLLMGILGRYEKNVMTWVRPSNGKLIDRSIRYVQYLLSAKGQQSNYEDIAKRIFSVYRKIGDEEAVVIRVVEDFMLEIDKEEMA